MVDQAVHDGDRHVVVGEELTPGGEVLVGGDDHRAVLVQGIDQLEQVVSGLAVHRQVAQLVDDQQVELLQRGDLLFQLTLDLGQFQLLHQGQRGGEQHLVAGLDGLLADADGQVGLAHPRRADEHQVGALVDELEVQQLVDLALGDGGLVAVVELRQALVHREARLAPVHLDPPLVAPLLFMGHQGLGEGQVGDLIGLGLAQQVGQPLGDVVAADAAVLMGNLLNGGHDPPPGQRPSPCHSPPANGGSGGGIGGRWIDEPPRVGGIGLEVVAALAGGQGRPIEQSLPQRLRQFRMRGQQPLEGNQLVLVDPRAGGLEQGAQAGTRGLADLLADGHLQVGDPGRLVAIVVVVAYDHPFVLGDGMMGDLLAALQVRENQPTALGAHPHPAALVGHRNRVLVGVP